MKIPIIIPTILFLFVFSGTLIADKYSGGNGEPNTPYLISTAEDLNDIGNQTEDWNKHFIMVNDINLADYTGKQFKIIGRYYGYDDPNNQPFTGVFDGNGYTIFNFTYKSEADCGVGIFGYVCDPNAVIKNLVLENCDVNSVEGYLTGSLVGYNADGLVSNCRVSGIVHGGTEVGGLVGSNGRYAFVPPGVTVSCESTIQNCSVDCYVYGNENVGGITGLNFRIIVDSNFTGCVKGGESVGGLTGFNSSNISPYKSFIISSYAFGLVSGTLGVGGLVGYNYSDIRDCYSKCDVYGSEQTGGFVGCNNPFCSITRCFSICNVLGEYQTGCFAGENQGMITNSYAKGIIDGNDITGGFIGKVVHKQKINYCYAAVNVSGLQNTGGFIGYSTTEDGLTFYKCFWDRDINPDVNGIGNSSDPNVIGKTTVEMKKVDTFTDANWDLIEIWDIGENQTYPFLRTHPAGDINKDDIVNFSDLAIVADHWLEE